MTKTKNRGQAAYAAYLRRRRKTDSHARHHRQDGTYFHVFASDERIMSADELLVISHLINHAQSRADDDGWLWNEPSIQKKGLGIDRREDRRIMASLSKRGFISIIRTDDQPRRRYITIHTDAILAALSGRVVKPMPKRRGFFD